jgi:hypothetical protein
MSAIVASEQQSSLRELVPDQLHDLHRVLGIVGTQHDGVGFAGTE